MIFRMILNFFLNLEPGASIEARAAYEQPSLWHGYLPEERGFVW